MLRLVIRLNMWMLRRFLTRALRILLRALKPFSGLSSKTSYIGLEASSSSLVSKMKISTYSWTFIKFTKCKWTGKCSKGASHRHLVDFQLTGLKAIGPEGTMPTTILTLTVNSTRRKRTWPTITIKLRSLLLTLPHRGDLKTNLWPYREIESLVPHRHGPICCSRWLHVRTRRQRSWPIRE